MTDPTPILSFPAITVAGKPISADSTRALTGRGICDVMVERVRQIDDERFDLAHDLAHHPGELALASASYLNTAIDQLHGKHHLPQEQPDTWPWQREAWRPGNARANLVKALAIGLATLDRIDGDALGSGKEPL